MRKRKKRIRWGRILCLLFIVYLIINSGKIAKHLYPVHHVETIKHYAYEYQIDPYLIVGIIKTESNFNPSAVSGKQATGLMQIMEPTAYWLAGRMKLDNFSYDAMKDPNQNIQMGCYYLNYLLSHYDGNVNSALAAYNAGEGTVDKWLADASLSSDGKNLNYIPYPETRHYIEKVNNNQKIYRALYSHKDPFGEVD